jgi:hypothetical protein
MWVGFEQPRDVSEILLPLARSAVGIFDGPDFSLQDVLDIGDRKPHAQNVTFNGATYKRRVSGIELDLHAEVAVV